MGQTIGQTLTFCVLTCYVTAHKQIADLVDEPQFNPNLENDLSSNEGLIENEAPKKDFNWFIQAYQMESIAICFLLGAVAFMFIGKSRNYGIAMSWHTKALPILQE
jgi:hypothetical protein